MLHAKQTTSSISVCAGPPAAALIFGWFTLSCPLLCVFLAQGWLADGSLTRCHGGVTWSTPHPLHSCWGRRAGRGGGGGGGSGGGGRGGGEFPAS